MDKTQFIKVAPEYYAVAIVYFFLDQQRRQSTPARLVDSLDEEWSRNLERDVSQLLMTPPLFYEALRRLSRRGFIGVIEDAFAPTIILKAEAFAESCRTAEADSESLLAKFAAVNQSLEWLCGALDGVEQRGQELGISDADFDVADLEWEPIPLDRDEPDLQVAIEAVETVVEAVRADNGYAVTVPEERRFVLEGLSVLTARLKTSETVSAPFIRAYGIDPFQKLIRRFGGTAIELVVTAAKEALKEWLRKKGGGFLDWL